MVSEDEVEEVHVEREDTIHKMFCYDRESQDNTIFTDINRYNSFGGCPDATKTIAKIIVFVAFCTWMVYYIF